MKTATKDPKESIRQEKKGRKATKDPNKPKRPASAFFVFMEDFKKPYREKNPNVKSVPVVGKARGDKWKSMSDIDNAPFVAKAAKRKTEYEKNEPDLLLLYILYLSSRFRKDKRWRPNPHL